MKKPKKSDLKYKIAIDKEELKDFFLSETVTEKHQEEVNKVINVVMIKHFFKHYDLFPDLRQYAWLAVLHRRDKGEFQGSKGSAYNYIYSTCRNEVGNNIIKLRIVTGKLLTMHTVLNLEINRSV